MDLGKIWKCEMSGEAWGGLGDPWIVWTFIREGLRLGFGIWVGMELFNTGRLFAGKERKGLEVFEKKGERGGW